MGAHKFNPRAVGNSINGAGIKNVQINVDDLARKACSICKCTEFEQEFSFFEVPELLRYATQGNDTVIAQFWICKFCGAKQDLNSMILIESLKKAEKPVIEVVAP